MLAIFNYDFMWRALIAGFMIALVAPLIGTFLVSRHYAYLSDTLSHVALLGVVLGIIFNFSPMIGAVGIAILAALAVEGVREKQKFWTEAILSVFLSGSLALSVVLLSLKGNYNANLLSILFGSILTLSNTDVFLVSVLSLLSSSVIYLFYKEFFLVTLSEEVAVAEGVRLKTMNYILIILAAIIISLSIRTVGVLLISALMVIPVLTAFQFRKGFKKAIFLAIIISTMASIGGILLSFVVNLPSGGTIVTLLLIIFLISLFISRKV